MLKRRGGNIWLFLAIGAGIASGYLGTRPELSAGRNPVQLEAQNGQNAPPPELSLALSLGVFRSMILDGLWIRAGNMQREKRFFELVQLFDLIGILQPYDDKVWAFSAWNMSYNCSVAFPNTQPEERWRWVRNGLDRMLKHGLVYNPNNQLLLWETGWVFFHKIGMNLDDCHLFYKTKLAESMHLLFKDFPIQATQVEQAMLDSSHPKHQMALEIARTLKRDWHLDVEAMAKLENSPRFGPLDWRLAEVHSIYWATQALEHGTYGKREVDLQRMVYQSMQHLLKEGQLIYFPADDKLDARVVFWPDTRQIPPICRMFEEEMDIFAKQSSGNGTVRSAYGYFLEEAIELLYFAGQQKEAETLFKESNEKLPDILSGTSAADHIDSKSAERFKSMSSEQLSALAGQVLLGHFWWKAQGDEKRSAGQYLRALKLWQLNQKLNKHKAQEANQRFDQLELATLSSILKAELFHPLQMQRLKQRVDPELLKKALAGLGST